MTTVEVEQGRTDLQVEGPISSTAVAHRDA